VTSHDNLSGLTQMLGNLMYQTRTPEAISVYCSETPDVARLREDFPDCTFSVQPNMNDWGHDKRSIGIAEATTDYIGFFNDDDEYSNDYVERMMAEAEQGAEIVYCGWNRLPDCSFCLASSTSGNFIVSTPLAKDVGWTGRMYEADGHFIDDLSERSNWITKVEEILYFHA
jgi:hypothetical protein